MSAASASSKRKQSIDSSAMAARRKSVYHPANQLLNPNLSESSSKKTDETAMGTDLTKLNCWGKYQNQEITNILITPTFKCSMFALCGIIVTFGLFGGLAMKNSNELNDMLIRYDDSCFNKTSCNVAFTPDHDLVNPKIYYRIENFFANHRNFVKSRNFKHNRGATTDADESQISQSCSAALYNKDMAAANNFSVNGQMLDPNSIALPCGLIAKYHFNDTYKITLANNDSQVIHIDEKNIALEADREHKFNTEPEKVNQTWLNLNDEHVMVWYQMESFSNFNKLWGHINQTLYKGKTYRLHVQNNWINITEFDAKKYIYLSEINAFGGKSGFIGQVFFFSAVACFMMMVIFTVLYFMRIRGKNIYSTSDMSWG